MVLNTLLFLYVHHMQTPTHTHMHTKSKPSEPVYFPVYLGHIPGPLYNTTKVLSHQVTVYKYVWS